MKQSSFITGICFYLIIMLPAIAKAQEPIQILNADQLEGFENDSMKLKRLTGNVQFKQNEMLMYCDRADFFDSENRVVATGHIQIIQADSVHIYGDVLDYNGNTRTAVIKQHVKLLQGKMELTTTELTYHLDTRIGYYNNSGTLTDDSSTLKSKIGYYYANTGDVFFKKDVSLTNPAYTLTADTLRFNVNTRTAFFVGPTNIETDSSSIFCEGGFYNTVNDDAMFIDKAIFISPPHFLYGDTLYYNRKTGTGLALQHVHWSDTSRHMFIDADYALYNEKNQSVLATRHALFTTLIGKDSMFLTADTLQSFLNQDSLRMILAYHHVKIFKSDLQVNCDSLSYSDADSTFRFNQNPVLWVDGNQLTADTISIQMKNNHPYKMVMRHNSFIADALTSENYNQVKGKNMTGFFVGDELHQLLVDGNGESIYYAGDDSSGYFGINKAACSSMNIIITNQKIDHIDFLTKPDATLYPLHQAPMEELKLKGFQWLIKLKPLSKADLLR